MKNSILLQTPFFIPENSSYYRYPLRKVIPLHTSEEVVEDTRALQNILIEGYRLTRSLPLGRDTNRRVQRIVGSDEVSYQDFKVNFKSHPDNPTRHFFASARPPRRRLAFRVFSSRDQTDTTFVPKLMATTRSIKTGRNFKSPILVRFYLYEKLPKSTKIYCKEDQKKLLREIITYQENQHKNKTLMSFALNGRNASCLAKGPKTIPNIYSATDPDAPDKNPDYENTYPPYLLVMQREGTYQALTLEHHERKAKKICEADIPIGSKVICIPIAPGGYSPVPYNPSNSTDTQYNHTCDRLNLELFLNKLKELIHNGNQIQSVLDFASGSGFCAAAAKSLCDHHNQTPRAYSIERNPLAAEFQKISLPDISAHCGERITAIKPDHPYDAIIINAPASGPEILGPDTPSNTEAWDWNSANFWRPLFEDLSVASEDYFHTGSGNSNGTVIYIWNQIAEIDKKTSNDPVLQRLIKPDISQKWRIKVYIFIKPDNRNSGSIRTYVLERQDRPKDSTPHISFYKTHYNPDSNSFDLGKPSSFV